MSKQIKQLNDFKEFENSIIDWATQRGLLNKNGQAVEDELIPTKQVVKIIEELGELSEDFNKRSVSEEHKRHLVDSIGDVLVTLTVFTHQIGLDMSTCYNKAWSHIANRTGSMENGTYIADKDKDK